MKTVNGGIVININEVSVEILSHNFHNPNCDIVCHYFMDGNKKVELTYYKDIYDNRDGHEIYMFDGAKSIQHYYSRNYRNNVPAKYQALATVLKDIFNQIDFNKYKTREVI